LAFHIISQLRYFSSLFFLTPKCFFVPFLQGKETKELAISNAKMQVQMAKMCSLPFECNICWFVVMDAVCLFIWVYDT